MADFCLQCSQAMGFDSPDLAHLSTPEDSAKGLYPVVLCEGCGPIQVDHTGKCISPDCLEKHNDPNSSTPTSD